jgi:phage/plasmid-like protein (TIGR03299 family)
MAGVAVEGAVVPTGADAQSRPDLFGTRGQFRPDGSGGLISMMNAGDKPEYATPEASKVESGFYVASRGLPWHVTLSRQLGTRELMAGADGLLGLDDALEMAGGDYEVGLHEVFTDSGILIPHVKATVREDTQAPLGVVGNAYRVFGNRVLGELADGIVGTGEALYETGAVMRGGADFLLSMELPGLAFGVPGDESGVQTYLLLSTSHDGSRPARFDVTTVRTVCANTERLAKAKASHTLRLMHRGTLNGKVAEARRVLGVAARDITAAKANAERLALTKVVDAQVLDILNDLWPVEDPEAEGKTSRSAAKAFEVYGESPNLDGIRGTGWGAYNAITEYIDHVAAFRGGARTDASERRATSLLFGRAADTKDRALDLILKS